MIHLKIYKDGSLGYDDYKLPLTLVHIREREMGKVKGEYGGVCGEEEGNTDYGGMMQLSQQHVAPCVKVVY